MTVVAALASCAILIALAIFQASLIAGAPLGHFAWGGQHRVLPGSHRIGSVVSIILYALFGAIIVQRAGLVAPFLPTTIVDIGIWVIVAYTALGIPLNAISRSAAERFTMTPVVIVLFGLVLTVAMGW